MISADVYLKDIESKPVYQFVYGYYDKLLDRYNKPFVEDLEPGLVLEQIKASVLKDAKNQIKFKDLCLLLFGKFDIKTGTFEFENEPVCLIDLDSIIVQEETHE